MYNDVDPAETVAGSSGDRVTSLACGEIGRSEVIDGGDHFRSRARRGENPHACFTQLGYDRRAYASGSTCYQRSLAFKAKTVAHGAISSDAILSPSSWKTKSTVT